MEPQTVPSTMTQKLPYTPPTATFVPLNLEERLLACAKADEDNCAAGPLQTS
jgi:hypothetical protein